LRLGRKTSIVAVVYASNSRAAVNALIRCNNILFL